jgi:phage baseplate assembly protein W
MTPADSQTALQRSIFGFDIATDLTLPGADIGRDIVFQGGDVAVVAGVANLSQALTLALTTRLGDNVFNATYGFDGIAALADETDPVLQRERIRVAVISLLQRDARVRQVTDVVLDGDVLSQSRTLDVSVSFITTASTQASVSLNTVVTGG